MELVVAAISASGCKNLSTFHSTHTHTTTPTNTHTHTQLVPFMNNLKFIAAARVASAAFLLLKSRRKLSCPARPGAAAGAAQSSTWQSKQVASVTRDTLMDMPVPEFSCEEGRSRRSRQLAGGNYGEAAQCRDVAKKGAA